MTVPAWIDRVPAPEGARAVLRVLAAAGAEQGCRIAVADLAARTGVSARTVLRALPQLEQLGLVEREGGERRVNTVRLLQSGDTRAATLMRCHQIAPDPEPPGDEYIPVADAAAAWRSRMVWAYQTRSGLAWWREAGRYLTEGGDLAALSTKARQAVDQAEGRDP